MDGGTLPSSSRSSSFFIPLCRSAIALICYVCSIRQTKRREKEGRTLSQSESDSESSVEHFQPMPNERRTSEPVKSEPSSERFQPIPSERTDGEPPPNLPNPNQALSVFSPPRTKDRRTCPFRTNPCAFSVHPNERTNEREETRPERRKEGRKEEQKIAYRYNFTHTHWRCMYVHVIYVHT